MANGVLALRIILSILVILYAGNQSLKAQSQSTDPRKTLIDDFVTERAKNPGIYQSPPINHMVPAFNTITYAGQFEEVDLKIKPNTALVNSYTTTDVSLTGFRMEPHLALSLKNISIGFSIQRDKLEENYKSISGSGGNSFEQRQKSTLEASGVGFNAAFVPFPKLHKQLKLALILGGKSLNIKHSTSLFKSANGPVSFDDNELQSYRYTVNQYAGGINLSWYVFKHFALVPWLDSSYTDLADAKRSGSASNNTGQSTADALEGDWNLFFLSYPKLRYGLDFAVQIIGLELRLGGLLGSLASLNKKVDYIEDKSLLLSVSIEQTGN
ncbi:MAG: hypothetical protein NTX25_12010 [Proteobacteria bacterium]|nr:hypothetical protein [Pseudomonadota bacterium]